MGVTVKMATNHEGKKTFQAVVFVRQLQTLNKKLYPGNLNDLSHDTSQKLTEAWNMFSANNSPNMKIPIRVCMDRGYYGTAENVLFNFISLHVLDSKIPAVAI